MEQKLARFSSIWSVDEVAHFLLVMASLDAVREFNDIVACFSFAFALHLGGLLPALSCLELIPHLAGTTHGQTNRGRESKVFKRSQPPAPKVPEAHATMHASTQHRRPNLQSKK